MSDKRLLTGPCGGIESPWWRRDSNWKCQDKLRFPPWTSWQIYNSCCLELDPWTLQCVLFFCFFCFEIPNVTDSILRLWSYFNISFSYCFFPSSLSGNFSAAPILNAKWLCLLVFCNLSWDQLSALTPPPWCIWTAAKINQYLQIGILPLTSWLTMHYTHSSHFEV